MKILLDIRINPVGKKIITKKRKYVRKKQKGPDARITEKDLDDIIQWHLNIEHAIREMSKA